MATRAMTTDRKDTVAARLEVTRMLRADPASLWAALSDPTWLGDILEPPAERPDMIRVETDLAFTLSDDPRTLTFRKAAFVDLRVTTDAAGTHRGEIAWRASTMAPLFPVFAGSITLRDGTIHLRGAYAPPGGGVGLLVDRSFLHHFARRTGAWFLDRLNEHLASLANGGVERDA